jgi:hypothetical protein
MTRIEFWTAVLYFFSWSRLYMHTNKRDEKKTVDTMQTPYARVCVRVNCYCFCFRHWKDGMCVCATVQRIYLSIWHVFACMDIWMVLVYVRVKKEKKGLTYPISLQVNYCWCLIVVSYIEGIDICKQNDLSAIAIVAFFSLSLSLIFCYLIGTYDERLHRSLSLLFLLSPEGHFMLDWRPISFFSRFVFIPSGVAGPLLFVYVRIIVQALTCKLPMAYCTCNSFSTSFDNKRKKKIDSWNR